MKIGKELFEPQPVAGRRHDRKNPRWVTAKLELSEERAAKFRRMQQRCGLKENQLCRQLIEWAIDRSSEGVANE